MQYETKIKKYQSEFWYRSDAKKLAKRGWQVKDVEFVAKRRGCLGSLFYWLLFGWLFAILFQVKSGHLTVTYERRKS